MLAVHADGTWCFRSSHGFGRGRQGPWGSYRLDQGELTLVANSTRIVRSEQSWACGVPRNPADEVLWIPSDAPADCMALAEGAGFPDQRGSSWSGRVTRAASSYPTIALTSDDPGSLTSPLTLTREASPLSCTHPSAEEIAAEAPAQQGDPEH